MQKFGKRAQRYAAIRHDVFSLRNDFMSCYFAGVLYGDGCIYKNGVSQYVQMQQADLDIVEKFAVFVGLRESAALWVKDYKSRRAPTKRLKITSDRMVEDLAYFQVVPRKTYKGFVYPRSINDRGYILGLYDSDGFCYRDGSFYFYGTEVFAKGLAMKIEELGFGIRLGKKAMRENQSVEIWYVKVKMSSMSDFIMWLLNPENTPVFCERKLRRVLLSVHRGKVTCPKDWVNCWNQKLEMRSTCRVEGCYREARRKSRLCEAHYRRFLKTGKLETTKILERKLHLRHNCFFERKASEVSYFAGVLYGDGCVNSGRNQIELTAKDFDMVEGFAKFVGLPEEAIKNKGVYKTAHLSSSIMKRDLMGLGIVPRKSVNQNYRFPEGVDEIAYLKGLYDSDGSTDKSAIYFYGNEGFSRELERKLKELGFANRLFVGKRCWGVRVNKASSIALASKLLNKPCRNQRKHERLFKILILDGVKNSGWKAKVREDYANQQPSRIEIRKVQRLLEEGTPSLMTSLSAQPLFVG